MRGVKHGACLALISFFMALPLMAPPTASLPLVDAGLFVILGVSTCRDGAGYCLLGSDCTLDHDFSPDDTGGHCNGLRAAFTPAANFVCCKYNGAEVKTSTTTPATITTQTPLITTPKYAPSKRPVISTGGNTKPQSTSSAESPGAVFWVDLAPDSAKPTSIKNEKPSGITKLGETLPGSSITVSGHVASGDKVPVFNNAVSIENWIKPGLTMNLPGIIASNPGSTVTIADKQDLILNNLVHGISSEVVHGISITQGGPTHPTPSLALMDVNNSDKDNQNENQQEENSTIPEQGGIENHQQMTLKPEVEAVVKPSEDTPAGTSKPDSVNQRPAVGTTVSKPTVTVAATTAKPTSTTPDDEDDDEDEDSEEEDDEEDDDDDDGLFGFGDLVDYLGIGTGGAAAVGAAKNTSGPESKEGDSNLDTLEERMDEVTAENEAENLVGGFLGAETATVQTPVQQETSPPAAASTPADKESEDEEELPPLCLGPVREPRDPACWAVQFETRPNASTPAKPLCSGARVARDLVVTSASCAVRVFMAGVHETRALLPGSEEGAAVSEVVVHENYRAAPHAALNDIGLVRLSSKGPDMDMCTLCLPQESKADYSHGSCLSPRFSSPPKSSLSRGDGNEQSSHQQVELVSRSTSPRAVCENVTRARTEDNDRFPVFLCAPPPRITKQQVGRIGPVEGSPLVCRGRRSIPVLAGVLMAAAASHESGDFTLFTPVSPYIDWIQANQLPSIAASMRQRH